MSANRSSAVMQQRREPHHSLDDFPTPPWATRALCEWLHMRGLISTTETVREPAANRGHMVRSLREYFATVEASDVHDYGAGFPVLDYLFGPPPPVTGWTITNPPFRLAEQFVQRALDTSETGAAVIVRSAFLEGIGRYDRLFSIRPPTDVLQFTERVVMVKGRLDPDGSSATAYCWLVWDLCRAAEAPRFHWLPPCRRRLERPEDYLPHEPGRAGTQKPGFTHPPGRRGVLPGEAPASSLSPGASVSGAFPTS